MFTQSNASPLSAVPIRMAIFLLTCLLALAAFSAGPAGAEEKRIAVAAIGDSEDALISPRTARPSFILIFNQDAELIESHANPVTRTRRAGPAMALWLAEHDVDVIIGERIGMNLVEGLVAVNIQGVEKSGRASDAVRELLE